MKPIRRCFGLCHRQLAARVRPWHTCLALLVGLTLTTDAAAQNQQPQEGPVFGAIRRVPPFSLEPVHGYLEGTWRQTNSSASAANGQDTSTRDTLYRETLSLNTHGHIVHPNLISFDLGGSIGFQQDSFQSGGATDETHGTLYSWDVTAHIVQNSNSPLTLYTNQSISMVDRSFGPTLNDTQTNYGAELTLQSVDVPTTLRLSHNEDVQTSLNGVEDYSLSEDAFDWNSVWRPTFNQTFTWNYHYRTSEQSVQSATPTSQQDQNATLIHTISFGRDYQSSLDSSLDYSQQSGQFDSESIRWDEFLRLWHTRSFQTDYSYSLSQQSFDTVDQTTQRATAGFHHQLFDSLSTNGRVGVNQLDLSAQGDNSTSTEKFANLNFTYRKRVPYGRFYGGLGFGYSIQENDAQSVAAPVRNQPAVISDFTPTIIRQNGFIPGSLIVTDSSGRIFVEDLDYRVTTLPDAFQIQGVPGGAIADGQTVLLNYDLSPQAAATSTTDSFSLHGRYQIERGMLSGVGFYARYYMQDQSIESSSATIRPNSVNDLIYGVDYRVRDLLLSAEHEIYDSTVSPFETTRLKAHLTRRLSYQTTLSAVAEYQMTEYPDSGDQTDYLLVSGNVEYYFTRELSLSASAAWVDQRSELSGPSRGTQEALELRWRHRQVSAFARVRNVDLTTEDQDTSFQFFQVGLRRDF